MKRLSRPLLFTSIAVSAMITFVAAGSWAATPIDVTDISGWLRVADPVDALAELARVAGLLLAGYVALVSAAALVAEVAAILRLPRMARVMRQLVHLFAVPALRKRLLEVAAVATVTASSLHAVPAGAATAPPPAVVVVSPDAVPRSDMPAVQLGGEFMGFDLPSTIATAGRSTPAATPSSPATRSGTSSNVTTATSTRSCSATCWRRILTFETRTSSSSDGPSYFRVRLPTRRNHGQNPHRSRCRGSAACGRIELGCRQR